MGSECTPKVEINTGRVGAIEADSKDSRHSGDTINIAMLIIHGKSITHSLAVRVCEEAGRYHRSG